MAAGRRPASVTRVWLAPYPLHIHTYTRTVQIARQKNRTQLETITITSSSTNSITHQYVLDDRHPAGTDCNGECEWALCAGTAE